MRGGANAYQPHASHRQTVSSPERTHARGDLQMAKPSGLCLFVPKVKVNLHLLPSTVRVPPSSSSLLINSFDLVFFVPQEAEQPGASSSRGLVVIGMIDFDPSGDFSDSVSSYTEGDAATTTSLT